MNPNSTVPTVSVSVSACCCRFCISAIARAYVGLMGAQVNREQPCNGYMAHVTADAQCLFRRLIFVVFAIAAAVYVLGWANRQRWRERSQDLPSPGCIFLFWLGRRGSISRFLPAPPRWRGMFTFVLVVGGAFVIHS